MNNSWATHQAVKLDIGCSVKQPRLRSQRATAVADLFGLPVGGCGAREIVAPFTMSIAPGEVVFITGPSGGGKSTILGLIGEWLSDMQDVAVIDSAAMEMPAGDAAVVDVLGDLSLNAACAVFARAGLGDAYALITTVAALSDGQRYRLLLAQIIAAAEQAAARHVVVLIDEFGSTLDRITARVIARQMARWARRCGLTLVAATAHDDLEAALQPDVVICKGLTNVVEVVR